MFSCQKENINLNETSVQSDKLTVPATFAKSKMNCSTCDQESAVEIAISNLDAAETALANDPRNIRLQQNVIIRSLHLTISRNLCYIRLGCISGDDPCGQVLQYLNNAYLTQYQTPVHSDYLRTEIKKLVSFFEDVCK